MNPTIVIVPGAGDTPASWTPVRRHLERVGKVVTYARAGMGAAPGPQHRMLHDYLLELDAVVAVEEEPVILVGHSFGGLLAQVYAQRHPHRVAGMVLVDATPMAIAENRAVSAGFAVSAAVATMLRLLTPTGGVRLLLALRALPLYPEQRRFERLVTEDELRHWKEEVERNLRTGTVTELRSVLPAARAATHFPTKTSAPDIPVALLTSRAYGAEWIRMHDDIAKRYPGSEHDYTGDRHHNVHMVHPALVADATHKVLRRIPAAQPLTGQDGD